jgi:DNA-binding response OmpR family regulator
MATPPRPVLILTGVTSPSPAAEFTPAAVPVAGRRIAVIEDEESIAAAVATRLRSEGYEVEIAGDGPGGVELCERFRPDLVVLDLMLPGLDGIEVCKQIQREHPLPVLMLTARDSETDMLVGLAVGADDYMTKPFSARELVARVHALLRRAERPASGDDRSLRIGSIEMDAPSRRVRQDGELVHLTPIEFDLLQYLASRPGRVASREELLVKVWGYEVPSGARTVDSHIRSIRRKLGADVVRTVHGVGYAVDEGAE